jgi:hypothetical protein
MAAPSRSGRARPARASVPGRARTAGRPAKPGRYARSTSTARRTRPSVGLRRRQPQPTGVKKIAAAAGNAVPASGKGKAGSAALVATAAAAAGVALKNRDKILNQIKQRTSGDDKPPATPPVNAAPPATPTI